MLIAMFGDLHLNPFKEFAKYEGGLNSRLVDTAKALESVYKIANDNSADLLFFLGDWFDEKNRVDVATVDISNKVNTALPLTNRVQRGLSEHLLEYTAIAGNHDSYGIINGNYLTTFSYIRDTFSYIVSTPVIHRLEGNTHLVFLPHTPLETATEFMRDVYYRMSPNDVLYVFGHMDIEGAIAGTSELSIGHVTPVSLFDNPQVKGVFLGHYHKHQKIGSKIWYTGSPIQINFGEENERKGVMFLETVTGEVKFVEIEDNPFFRTICVNEEEDLVEVLDYVNESLENTRLRVKLNIDLDKEVVNEMRRAGMRVEVKTEEKAVIRLQASDDDNVENIIQPYVEFTEKDKTKYKKLVKIGLEKLREA